MLLLQQKALDYEHTNRMLRNWHCVSSSLGFPMTLEVKNPHANAGDSRDGGSIPGSERSAGEGHGSPLWYSCLENPMDRGALWATVHRLTKSWTQLKDSACTHSSSSRLSSQVHPPALRSLPIVFLSSPLHPASRLACSPHLCSPFPFLNYFLTKKKKISQKTKAQDHRRILSNI